MTVRGVQLADILEFPKPGTTEHNLLKLKVYRAERVGGWHNVETEVFDTATNLYELGLIDIQWEDGEPLYQLSSTGKDLCKHVQIAPG